MPACPCALQGIGDISLPNSAAPLAVRDSENISHVVAGWETTFGIVGNDSLAVFPPTGSALGDASSSASSFAVGAIVGIVAVAIGESRIVGDDVFGVLHPRLEKPPGPLAGALPAVVVVALLGVLAWRKGWLHRRRKPVPSTTSKLEFCSISASG